MADGRQDWDGLDAPRPLPAGLRHRLEDSLLTDSPRALRPTLANRLSYALADDGDGTAQDAPADAGPGDDTSRLLVGLDASRPLPRSLSDRLTGGLLGLPSEPGPLPSRLAGGRAAVRFRAAAGMAAACLLLAGGAVALDHSPAGRPAASRPGSTSSPFHGTSQGAASPLSGGSGAGAGGSMASGSAQPGPGSGAGSASSEPGARTSGPAAAAPAGSAVPSPAQPGAAAGAPSAASGAATGSQGGAGSTAGTPSAGAPSGQVAPVGGPAPAGAGGSGPSPGGAAPSPVLSSLTPDQGPAAGGTWVTIAGSELSGASAVRFGSVPAYHFQVLSPSEIRAEAPPHAPGKVEVIVVTPAGSTRPGEGSVYLFTTG